MSLDVSVNIDVLFGGNCSLLSSSSILPSVVVPRGRRQNSLVAASGFKSKLQHICIVKAMSHVWMQPVGNIGKTSKLITTGCSQNAANEF